MLKMGSESFVHGLLLFLGLFLKISRWVPLYLVCISKLVLKFRDQLCDMTMQMKPHLAKLSGSSISYSYFRK